MPGRGMGGRTLKKYLLLAVVSVSLVGFFYQYNSPTCFTKPGVTEYIGPEVGPRPCRTVVPSDRRPDSDSLSRTRMEKT